MLSFKNRMEEINILLDNNQAGLADEKMSDLIKFASIEEININIGEIEQTINRFLNKRKRDLTIKFKNKISREATGNSDLTPVSKEYNLVALTNRLRLGLNDLSERHIFQWSTYYRDFFNNFLNDLSSILSAYDNKLQIIECVTGEVLKHSAEIFKKGYEYSIATNLTISNPVSFAINKSLGGLQKFLEIIIEYYSAALSSTLKLEQAPSLRQSCSAVLCGVLKGYGEIEFRGEKGACVLSRSYPQWLNFVPFLTYPDSILFLEDLDKNDLKEGLRGTVLPILYAIDKLLSADENNYVLPKIGQCFGDSRKLNISLQILFDGIKAKPITIQCYTNSDNIYIHNFNDSVSKGVDLIVAQLTLELSQTCESDEALRHSVIDICGKDESFVADKAQRILRFVINQQISHSSPSAPITFNFAKEFPLRNPFVAKFFHVHRASVRELLRSFDQRNGVRLWCSVRRSGKTTACFELNDTTGTSIVVTQTCENTDQIPNAGLFYDSVLEAINLGKQIPNDFFNTLVANCGTSTKSDALRYIFVLDEYESLFERLRFAANRDEELKYTVVRPLLNQMVSFSKNNLLVFIGQRPDAHYILMDQNQLSAYVQQDAFPLFAHNAGDFSSEFCLLLRRVFTERVTFDSSFVDSFHAETSGHPFLTVNVSILFFDWLIECKRPLNKLLLTDVDFNAFSKDKLNSKSISLSTEFDFFKHGIGQALGSEGKRSYPWVHAIYSIIKQILNESPKSFRCSLEEYRQIVANLKITEELGYTAEDLLTTGVSSNFLNFANRYVGPKIKILARLTQITTPKITW